MFTMECLNAKEGDCIIFHYGDATEPRFVMVDSGSSGTYNQVLKKRLVALKKDHFPDDPIYFELGMVSHIDNDHIKGFLDYFKKEKEGKNPETGLMEFGMFWHNSLRHLTDKINIAGAAAGSPITANTADTLRGKLGSSGNSDGRMNLILASFPQGNALEEHLKRWGIGTNAPMGGVVGTHWDEISLDGEMKFTITGPSAERIDELDEKWPRDKPDVEVAAYLDKEISNLSSITAVVEFEGKSVLLTGDARGDDLLKGLEERSLLSGDGKAHFNVLKMPHHGSSRNMEVDFLKRVTADIYVFSANGKHDNPDAETLDMLREARPGATFKLVFTNSLEEIKGRLKHATPEEFDTAITAIKSDCDATIETRGDGELSVSLKLST